MFPYLKHIFFPLSYDDEGKSLLKFLVHLSIVGSSFVNIHKFLCVQILQHMSTVASIAKGYL
jgi:hypothetical protein